MSPAAGFIPDRLDRKFRVCARHSWRWQLVPFRRVERKEHLAFTFCCGRRLCWAAEVEVCRSDVLNRLRHRAEYLPALDDRKPLNPYLTGAPGLLDSARSRYPACGSRRATDRWQACCPSLTPTNRGVRGRLPWRNVQSVGPSRL